jgi:hypothetical protein
MSLPQTATDDAWRQTLERLGMRIRWLGTTDKWAPSHQRTDQRQGIAARDALRVLLHMGAHQPYPFIHSWGLRPGRRDADVTAGLYQFEGWKVTSCTIENPGTDTETWVFSTGKYEPPSKDGVQLIAHLEEHLVFPPERADYTQHRLPLLGVELFEYVPLELPKPAPADDSSNADKLQRAHRNNADRNRECR